MEDSIARLCKRIVAHDKATYAGKLQGIALTIIGLRIRWRAT